VIQGKIGIIGNGVVIDPEILIKEIDELTEKGKKPKLLISDRANIIMPYHKILDGAEEELLGDRKIGTTKRGIGPCYSDKVARNGIRAIDLTKKDTSNVTKPYPPMKQNFWTSMVSKQNLIQKKSLKPIVRTG